MAEQYLIHDDATFDTRIGLGYRNDPKKLRLLAFMALGDHVDLDYINQRRWGGGRVDEATTLSLLSRIITAGPEVDQSRFEQASKFAQDIADDLECEAIEGELARLIVELDENAEEEATEKVIAFLRKHHFAARHTVEPSPLFPDGREQVVDFSRFLPTRDDFRSGKAIVSRSGMQILEHDVEALRAHLPTSQDLAPQRDFAAEKYSGLSRDELRLQYGAKAANLIYLRENIGDDPEQQSAIPPFVPVDISLYETWRLDDDAFREDVEQLRNDALAQLATFMIGSSEGLVIVRSSAVYAEDGDNLTGAGVYQSVIAVPRDSESFESAVRAVYGSIDDPTAVSYREKNGVVQEKMGIIVQPYIEESGASREFLYGVAESSANRDRLLRVSTNHGLLSFDKDRLRQQRYLSSSLQQMKKTLHTHPDHHTSLGRSYYSLHDLPENVLRAEEIFGVPVQIEFVGRYTVQVRPVSIDTETSIEFPEELHMLQLYSNAVGDATLDRLEPWEDNRRKAGFVVVETEFEFTHPGSEPNADRMFPENGAVVILNPSLNGHVQTLCREKGLLCFYPEVGDGLKRSEVAMELLETNRIRFVCDGYEGRLYDATEASE